VEVAVDQHLPQRQHRHHLILLLEPQAKTVGLVVVERQGEMEGALQT
jgi:hypothetical protein